MCDFILQVNTDMMQTYQPDNRKICIHQNEWNQVIWLCQTGMSGYFQEMSLQSSAGSEPPVALEHAVRI